MYTWTVPYVPIGPFDDNQPEIDSVQKEQLNREKKTPAGRSITRSFHTRWLFDLRQCLVSRIASCGIVVPSVRSMSRFKVHVQGQFGLSSRRSRWKICSRTKRITDDVENEMSAPMNLDVDQKLIKRELKLDSASLKNDTDQVDLM